MDQRELLKEEEEEMEKKFEMIELLSDQVQRLVNDKESNGAGDQFISEPSSILLQQKWLYNLLAINFIEYDNFIWFLMSWELLMPIEPFM